MKQRFRLFRRGRVFYSQDNVTGKQESLHTKDKATAHRLFHARNEAHCQPAINVQIARVYLAASDPSLSKRTWQTPIDEIIKTKHDSTKVRWMRAAKDHALAPILGLPIVETRSEHFLKVLESGTVATNVYLRRIHNFSLDMGWLPWPILAKKQWPKLRYKEKRAITLEEHRTILDREPNHERKQFYQLAWHLGASQTDLASLEAEDIDWQNRVISIARRKTKSMALLHFGGDVEKILRSLPSSGPLFPYLRSVRSGDRATEFKRRCDRSGIKGVTLHSYRYAWAERAKTCGYPERFAQMALGHNSKAVHRAYAKKAQVKVPPLDEYEHAYAGGKVIPFDLQKGTMV